MIRLHQGQIRARFKSHPFSVLLPECCVWSGRYYQFDRPFAREVLGKKLSKGMKKDLDDISSKTGILVKSCRRQVWETSTTRTATFTPLTHTHT